MINAKVKDNMGAENIIFRKILPAGAAVSGTLAAKRAFESGNNVELTASSIEAVASAGLLTPAALASGLALGGVQMARTINDAACETGISSLCNEKLGPSIAGMLLWDRKGGGAAGVLSVNPKEAELGSITAPKTVPAALNTVVRTTAKIEK